MGLGTRGGSHPPSHLPPILSTLTFSPSRAGPAEGNISLLLTLVPEAPLLFFSTPSVPTLSQVRTIGLTQTEKRGKMRAKDFRGGYILIIYF